jgi:glyoxylase-like metal-dependent hydrolase (beta-lactamase superfamily II)
MERENLAQGVWIFKSRFAEMLSTLIGLDGKRAALIDPPMFADEAAEIRGFAAERGLSVDFLILTHAHGDHVYGAAHFPGALIIAHRSFWVFSRKIEAADQKFFTRFLPGYEIPEVRCPHLLLEDGSEMRLGRRLIFRHAHGHSPDGLMVELPDEGIWIVGDVVIPTPLLSSGSLVELKTSLRELLERFSGGVLVPGHGRALRGDAARGAIAANIEYLERLESAVRDAIAKGMELDELLEIAPECLDLSPRDLDPLDRWIHRENLRRAYEELSRSA